MENKTVRTEKEQLEVAKAAKALAVPPHDRFTFMCTPDEVAETWSCVPPTLYTKLWDLTSLFAKPTYSDGTSVSEENYHPDQFHELNTVAGFWDKFSEEDQIALNVLADRHEAQLAKEDEERTSRWEADQRKRREG
jgi:hypothetical protein